MIDYTASIDSASVKRLTEALKEAEGMAIADLRRELKGSMKPFASQIQSRIPTSSPFKGMERNYYGRVQWAQPTVKVSFTPGKKAIGARALLLTLVAEHKTKLGFNYTEVAGVRKRAPAKTSKTYHRKGDSNPRSHSVTTQGEILIDKARKVSKFGYKAGHFAYGEFLKLKPQMVILATVILEGTAKKLSVKLEKV